MPHEFHADFDHYSYDLQQIIYYSTVNHNGRIPLAKLLLPVKKKLFNAKVRMEYKQLVTQKTTELSE